MTIYKSIEGKNRILKLYDKQLQKLNTPYKDIYLYTTYGKTHIIETGNINKEPLLIFHGGNSTSAYTLLNIDYLFNDFHIYALDTIGHPGKSAEVSLSPNNYDYGKWASEVITKLGYESIECFSGSFGAGILAKTMCVAPEKIKKAVLYVPSGISNASPLNCLPMLIPMIIYKITNSDRWLKKTLMPMSIREEYIDDELLLTSKLSIKYSKVKAGMPSNVDGKLMKQCRASTLVMAAEKDILFPGNKVIARAREIIENCDTYLLKDRGHINSLTSEEKEIIRSFLVA
ncbi:MAG: alpha/beta fold hydrolase [Erysipelotrichaceae bacterium]